MTKKRWKRQFWRLSMTWNTNTKPPISRLHSSVLIILIRTFPFQYFFAPSVPSLAESISTILPNVLTPLYIVRKRSSWHPRVLSGKEVEESCRILQKSLKRYQIQWLRQTVSILCKQASTGLKKWIIFNFWRYKLLILRIIEVYVKCFLYFCDIKTIHDGRKQRFKSD